MTSTNSQGTKLPMFLRLTQIVMVWGAAFILVYAQEHPTEPHQHPEGRTLSNPYDPTPESISRGRQRYVFTCRQCHGNRGKGDGDMSHAGGIPSDLTDEVWQHGERWYVDDDNEGKVGLCAPPWPPPKGAEK